MMTFSLAIISMITLMGVGIEFGSDTEPGLMGLIGSVLMAFLAGYAFSAYIA